MSQNGNKITNFNVTISEVICEATHDSADYDGPILAFSDSLTASQLAIFRVL